MKKLEMNKEDFRFCENLKNLDTIFLTEEELKELFKKLDIDIDLNYAPGYKGLEKDFNGNDFPMLLYYIADISILYPIHFFKIMGLAKKFIEHVDFWIDEKEEIQYRTVFFSDNIEEGKFLKNAISIDYKIIVKSLNEGMLKFYIDNDELNSLFGITD